MSDEKPTSQTVTDGDENHLIAERKAKLERLRAKGPAFPNDFRRDASADELHTGYGDRTTEWLDAHPTRVTVAGRMMAKRIMGKASFAKISDRSGSIQLFLQQTALGETYDEFKGWDVGDIVGAEGTLFKTRTGELSVKVERLRLLVKSLRPLPDKWHGLADVESRYRQRYVDLIVSDESREVFRTRTRIVQYLRRFLDALDFMEVETPMLQVIPGGAVAKPFITHHNALDVDMYLRIAPELYLKRLVVGGFERVYEINRNFRNEGLSTRHNPEFTMLELYQAYADYRDLMDMVERMFQGIADMVCGTRTVEYQGEIVRFRLGIPPGDGRGPRRAFHRGDRPHAPARCRLPAWRMRKAGNTREAGGWSGQAADRDFREDGGASPAAADVRLCLPGRSLAARAPQRLRSVSYRPLRVFRRRPRDRQWLLGTQRRGRPGRAFPRAGGAQDRR